MNLALVVVATLLCSAGAPQQPPQQSGRWPERRPMDPQERVEAYARLCGKLDAIFTSLERRHAMLAGATTQQLDDHATALIHDRGLASAFRGLGGFPATITASLNDELTNGVPSGRRLADGDLLNLQIGVQDSDAFCMQGWSYCIGGARNPALVRAATEALRRGVAAARAGGRVRDITTAIQGTLEAAGFSPDRDFVGHAMDSSQRRLPRIPCAVSAGMEKDLDTELREGRILTIVVGAHAKGSENVLGADEWTVRSKDGGDAVLLSQVIVVRKRGPRVLLRERPSRCGEPSGD